MGDFQTKTLKLSLDCVLILKTSDAKLATKKIVRMGKPCHAESSMSQ